jgi:LysR family glycine cleavage system transcriptional activator
MMASEEVAAIDRIDIDLIVSRKPLHAPDIECLPLLEDRAIALCGPQTALAVGATAFPALLERAPLLFLEDEPQWGGLLAGVTSSTSGPTGAAPLRIRRGATIQDERLLLEAAELDLGVAYLSQVLAGASIERGRTLHLPQVPSLARPRLWLMRSRLTPRSGVVNRAFDWLLAAAGTLTSTSNLSP